MRGAPPPLTNFERGKTLLGHVKPLAVTVGSQEDVIVRAGVDCLGKCGIQVYGGCAPDPNFSFGGQLALRYLPREANVSRRDFRTG